MNKKEISEIRKQFTPERCTISRICYCYVTHEKEKLMQCAGAFLTLPEEETFKYFDIFKHTLSGSIGRTMANMEFPREAEAAGGTQHFLMKLLESGLKDEKLLEEFYDKVIENYTYEENYLIILTVAAYDVPGEAADNTEMFDASDTVYDYILCSICPVNLAKPGLCYKSEEDRVGTRVRDWMVENPMTGFLFPAFNDRASDIHSLLYYNAKAEKNHPEFATKVLGTAAPTTAGEQKETFQALVGDAVRENCGYEILKAVNENLNELAEAAKENPDSMEISCPEIRKLLETSGVPGENLEELDASLKQVAEKGETFLVSNIAETKKFSVKTDHIFIQAEADYADLIKPRVISGVPCLVITTSGCVEINGVPVGIAEKGERRNESRS